MNISTANFSVTLNPSKPSWALALSLSILYLLAAICILLVSIPALLKVIALAALTYLGVKAIKQHALLRADSSITAIVCSSSNLGSGSGNNKCKVILNNGKEFQTELISANCLFDYFIVFLFKNNTKKFKATIAKDAISQEQFYALRLYLRSINK